MARQRQLEHNKGLDTSLGQTDDVCIMYVMIALQANAAAFKCFITVGQQEKWHLASKTGLIQTRKVFRKSFNLKLKICRRVKSWKMPWPWKTLEVLEMGCNGPGFLQ